MARKRQTKQKPQQVADLVKRLKAAGAKVKPDKPGGLQALTRQSKLADAALQARGATAKEFGAWITWTKQF